MNPPLPNRPLKVMLPKPPSRIGAFFLFLGAMVLAGGIAWLSVPGLVRDAAILGNAEPATQARFVSGRCKSKLVLHFCDITYNRRGPQGTVREESHVGFFELHVGSRSVSLLQKRGDPSLVTSDIALDHYWNRVVTAGLFILLFGGGGLVALGQALRPRRIPMPVPRPVRSPHGTCAGRHDRQRGDGQGELVLALCPAQHRSGSGAGLHPHPPAGSYPFMLDRDGRTALAVTDAAGHAILLLDEALSVIDLTDGERGALFGWRQAMWAPQAAQPALATAGG